jgi:putative flippase GtrA
MVSMVEWFGMNAVTQFKKISSKSSLAGFVLVGALSTIIDFVVLNLFADVLHTEYHIAVALGFFAGLMNGYYLNSMLVFDAARTLRRYTKYAVTSLGGFVLTELIVNFLVEHEHFSSLNKAKLVAAALVLIWNFLLSKFWAFK